MIHQDELHIRTMTQQEVATVASAWAAKEGWNPGVHDADSFYRTDPNGFFVGLLGAEPVACISVIAYDESFGFLGFYIVKEGYRGLRHGITIWNHGIAYLGNRNIGLDGVVAQQENYKKSGFGFAYNNIRFEGVSKKYENESAFLVSSDTLSFQSILEFDTRYFPVKRSTFLTHWLAGPERHVRYAVEGGVIRGYGVIRKCLRGYKIGPLFAESPEYAEGLYEGLVNCIPAGEAVFLDIPDPNPLAGALVTKYGMQNVFETARMYTKKAPDINISHIYGVTTFELG